ncbi:hypothetical protein GOV08_00320 [Candidatus Woesearchaeota archaeon]|nr:hypothetical protein [Candidatus Woesearchaeota archaeon]
MEQEQQIDPRINTRITFKRTLEAIVADAIESKFKFNPYNIEDDLRQAIEYLFDDYEQNYQENIDESKKIIEDILLMEAEIRGGQSFELSDFDVKRDEKDPHVLVYKIKDDVNVKTCLQEIRMRPNKSVRSIIDKNFLAGIENKAVLDYTGLTVVLDIDPDKKAGKEILYDFAEMFEKNYSDKILPRIDRNFAYVKEKVNYPFKAGAQEFKNIDNPDEVIKMNYFLFNSERSAKSFMDDLIQGKVRRVSDETGTYRRGWETDICTDCDQQALYEGDNSKTYFLRNGNLILDVHSTSFQPEKGENKRELWDKFKEKSLPIIDSIIGRKESKEAKRTKDLFLTNIQCPFGLFEYFGVVDIEGVQKFSFNHRHEEEGLLGKDTYQKEGLNDKNLEKREKGMKSITNRLRGSIELKFQDSKSFELSRKGAATSHLIYKKTTRKKSKLDYIGKLINEVWQRTGEHLKKLDRKKAKETIYDKLYRELPEIINNIMLEEYETRLNNIFKSIQASKDFGVIEQKLLFYADMISHFKYDFKNNPRVFAEFQEKIEDLPKTVLERNITLQERIELSEHIEGSLYQQEIITDEGKYEGNRQDKIIDTLYAHAVDELNKPDRFPKLVGWAIYQFLIDDQNPLLDKLPKWAIKNRKSYIKDLIAYQDTKATWTGEKVPEKLENPKNVIEVYEKDIDDFNYSKHFTEDVRMKLTKYMKNIYDKARNVVTTKEAEI